MAPLLFGPPPKMTFIFGVRHRPSDLKCDC